MSTEIAGANVTADGITARPVYDFQPGAAFFDAIAPQPSATVFNVLDYGAVNSSTFDNRDAIQAAIQAAHDAGGGVVYIPPGTFGIGVAYLADGVTPDPAEGGVRLLDNVFLKGAGIGTSVLRIIDGTDQSITGIVRSPSGAVTTNFGIADLTLDGNRDNNGSSAKVDGFYCGVTPGSTEACADVYVLRVEAANCNGYGFDPHEQTHRLTIENSIATHNSLDGFTLDYQVDGVFTGNVSFGNDRAGFNIVTTTNDCVFIDNIAYDNGGAGIVVQRGGENIEGSHNISVQGGEVYGNQSDGIRLLYVANVEVTGVDIHDNGRNGLRIEGSSHVTVADNTLSNDSRVNTSTSMVNGVTTGSNAEIYIVQGNDTAGASGVIHAASYNLVTGNTITETAAVVAPYGVREVLGATDNNVVIDNVVSGPTTALVSLTGANSTLTHHGGDAAETITGGRAADFLYGGLGADTLVGGAGDDLLDGGGTASGSDSLRGGAGNDCYIVDHADAVITESAGAGYDTVETSLATYVLSSNLEQLNYSGTGNFTGSGNSLGNVIIGGGGDDRLNGNAGDDLLIGLGGINTLVGGTGNDTYFMCGGIDIVIETANSGFDTVFTNFAGTTSIMANVEQLVLYGKATGAIGSGGNDVLYGTQAFGAVTLDGAGGDDVISGSQWDDTLIGGAGNDILIGAAGADTLQGGGGNDMYSLNGNDIVVEAAGAGFDTVFTDAAGTTTIMSNVEQLVIYGNAMGAVGSDGNDTLSAAEALGGVTLDGGAGNDLLVGSRAGDTLFGGIGNDILSGGAGNDRLVGGDGDDTYDLTNGADTVVEAAGAGNDLAFTNHAGITTIMANVETLAIFGAATGAIGSNGDDTLLVGTALGAVTLDGMAGNDVLRGGQWDDRIIGGAGDDELTGNGGSDVFDFRSAGSGADVIKDFDANPAGGMDLIDVSGRGFDPSSVGTAIIVVNSADGFASVTIGGDTIKVLGVTASELTASHFIF